MTSPSSACWTIAEAANRLDRVGLSIDAFEHLIQLAAELSDRATLAMRRTS